MQAPGGSGAKRTWTDKQLLAAIAASTSWSQVLRHLGLSLRGRNHVNVQRRAHELAANLAHFPHRIPTGTCLTWNDEQLRAAVAGSRSFRQTIQALGIVAAGANYAKVKRRIAALALDTTHFTGMRWNVGGMVRTALPLDQVLVVDRPTNSHGLKLRLFRARLKTRACDSAAGRKPHLMVAFPSNSITSTAITPTTAS